jgi:phosphate transport system substrate-binding protein
MIPHWLKDPARALGGLGLGLMLTAFSLPAAAGPLKLGGTGAALGGMERLATAFTARRPDVPVEVVPGLGSTGGIKALLAGAIDIALTSRELRAGEAEAGAVARPYASTPFLLATDLGNPADGISLAQLIDVYHGRTMRWPGGGAIRLVLRPKADSDTDLLSTLAPAMVAATEAAHQRVGLKVATTDQDAADAIAALPGSLGTSTAALILAERRPIKMLALDGVAPTAANLRSGAYPLSKTFAIVTRATPPADARAFIDFVWSPEGQAILGETGHLPLGGAPGA